jgi:hypothetical protein
MLPRLTVSQAEYLHARPLFQVAIWSLRTAAVCMVGFLISPLSHVDRMVWWLVMTLAGLPYFAAYMVLRAQMFRSPEVDLYADPMDVGMAVLREIVVAAFTGRRRRP